MRKYYNKLVRDKIPNMMKEIGKSASFKKIETDADFENYLNMKLKEEIKEYLSAKDIHKLEELYDIVEVCLSLAKKIYKTGERDFMLGKNKKSIEKGSFDEGIILKSIKEI